MSLVLFLLAWTLDSYPSRDLLDEDLVRFQASPYDKRLLERTRVILGHHHGTMVVADFPCSDVCPNYTTRIIHYVVDPGPACAAIGGIERAAMVPHGIAVRTTKFCVPKVLGAELIREGD